MFKVVLYPYNFLKVYKSIFERQYRRDEFNILLNYILFIRQLEQHPLTSVRLFKYLKNSKSIQIEKKLVILKTVHQNLKNLSLRDGSAVEGAFRGHLKPHSIFHIYI